MFTKKPIDTKKNTPSYSDNYQVSTPPLPPYSSQSSFRRNIFIGFVGIVLMCIVFMGVHIYRNLGDVQFTFSMPQAILSLVGETMNVEIQKEIVQTTSMKQSPDGKTNFLIIGRGGVENEAPNLTDSILLASLHYEKKTFSLLSIPRDLYVTYTTGGKGKINEAYFR